MQTNHPPVITAQVCKLYMLLNLTANMTRFSQVLTQSSCGSMVTAFLSSTVTITPPAPTPTPTPSPSASPSHSSTPTHSSPSSSFLSLQLQIPLQSTTTSSLSSPVLDGNRPTFTAIVRALSRPDTNLLKWTSEDKSVDPTVAQLGRKLKSSLQLFRDLQVTYHPDTDYAEDVA